MKQKVSKIDYSKAMLPRTRKAQFLDCFKMNYLLLLKCGLMFFAFALPLIAFSIFMDFYYMSIIEHATEAVEQTKLVFFYFYNGGVVLLLLPVVLGLCGVMHILKNFIWEEGIFFVADFGTGIKENAGKSIVFYLICAVLYLLSYFIYSMFTVPIVSYAPLFIFAFIIFPIFLWVLFLNNTYTSHFAQLLRNGTFFYVKSLGWSLLASLMCFVPIALLYVPFYFIWLKYVFLVMFFVFIFPIVVLIMTLYCNSKFDEYINKESYPDHYLKGLNHD